MTKMETMLNEVTNKAAAYAKAYNDGGKKKSELKALRKAATGELDRYNLELSRETYRQWAVEGAPVYTAIRTRVIPGAKKLQFKTDDEDYMTVIIAENTEYEVNLPMMQATIGADAFSDPKWFNKAERLAFLIATHLNEHMGNAASFQYAINKASAEFSFPEGIDPLTDDGVVYALQCVFDAILFIDDSTGTGKNLIHTTLQQDNRGEYYAKEWQVIRESMTRAAGVNKVEICNTGKFTSYILNAMHGILTNGSFGLIAEKQDKTLADKPEGVEAADIHETETEALRDE